jgi:predicted TIM-barrel fold metal-dependent hydrolase
MDLMSDGSPALVVDFDNHYYEPPDTFTRYIDDEYRLHTVTFQTGPNFENYMFVNGEPCIAIPDFSPPAERAGTEDFFSAMEHDRLSGHARHNPTSDWFSSVPLPWRDRAARIALMNEQGVHSAALHPTASLLWQDQVFDKPDLAHAINRAFNRWLLDDWGYNYDNRIFGVPEIVLLDIDQAVDELERVLAAGARAVNLHVGPFNGQSPASTRFDPFWQLVSDASIVVTFHLAASPYSKAMGALWGEESANWRSDQSRWNAFHWFTTWGDRPIMDTLVNLVFWNLFGRFPGLKVASVENGGGAWVEYTLRKIGRMAVLGRHGSWPGGRLTEEPGDIFRDHVYIVPFPEDDLKRLLAVYPADRVLFGSDFPHPEGMPEPMTIMERASKLDEATTRDIVGRNAARLLQLTDGDVAALLANPDIDRRATSLIDAG